MKHGNISNPLIAEIVSEMALIKLRLTEVPLVFRQSPSHGLSQCRQPQHHDPLLLRRLATLPMKKSKKLAVNRFADEKDERHPRA